MPRQIAVWQTLACSWHPVASYYHQPSPYYLNQFHILAIYAVQLLTWLHEKQVMAGASTRPNWVGWLRCIVFVQLPLF